MASEPEDSFWQKMKSTIFCSLIAMPPTRSIAKYAAPGAKLRQGTSVQSKKRTHALPSR